MNSSLLGADVGSSSSGGELAWANRLATAAAVVFVLAAQSLAAVPKAMPDLLTQRWPAQWITHPDAPARDYAVLFFRRELTLAEAPKSFPVHVSADERYRLMVNGQQASFGPARGDLLNWRYETVDLAPLLRPGRNVLAAQVWKLAEGAPWAQMTARLGFILQGATPESQAANTGPNWKVLLSDAYRSEPALLERKAWIPVGCGDHVDGTKYPWGWETVEFGSQGWKQPRAIGPGCPRGMRDGITEMGWLVPRNIPPLEQKVERLAHIDRTSGMEPVEKFLAGTAPLLIPARKQVSMLLDQSHLTVGFPELLVSGGRGGQLRLSYAEALFDAKNKKGHRDQIEGRKLVGLSDVFLPDGAAKRLFRPLWVRTWRYMQVDIRTGDEPLVLENLRGVFTAYPFAEKARFESNDAALKAIWNTGWRTARLCAGETFFDCPYYEQLQYIGDTRVEALITLCVSGDDRLMRNAISTFDQSRVFDGLTASRHPSRQLQLIPPYSLFWIAMLHDYWMYRGDEAFLRPMLGGADLVLRWYEMRLADNGLFGPMEWWNFTDWCDGWERGEPPGTSLGGSSVIALQFVYNAQLAAELFAALGEPDRAAHWRAVAERVRKAVAGLCWDSGKGLFADTPAKATFSQHANILAVLTGTCEADRCTAVVEKVLADTSLTPCTLYFRFYLHQAMARAGLGDRYLGQLKPWRDMLAIGLTTFAEKPEPTRSDCHAWSACPNYDFLTIVCGIQPASAGFTTVRIAPALGELPSVAGAMPHPKGTIEVRFARRGPDGISADISLPDGLMGELVWSGKTTPLVSGKQHVER